jgi:hypothetical protein
MSSQELFKKLSRAVKSAVIANSKTNLFCPLQKAKRRRQVVSAFANVLASSSIMIGASITRLFLI